jgi:hypothetical protein
MCDEEARFRLPTERGEDDVNGVEGDASAKPRHPFQGSSRCVEVAEVKRRRSLAGNDIVLWQSLSPQSDPRLCR